MNNAKITLKYKDMRRWKAPKGKRLVGHCSYVIDEKGSKSIITVEKDLRQLESIKSLIHEFCHFAWKHYFAETKTTKEEENFCREVDKYAVYKLKEAIGEDI